MYRKTKSGFILFYVLILLTVAGILAGALQFQLYYHQSFYRFFIREQKQMLFDHSLRLYQVQVKSDLEFRDTQGNTYRLQPRNAVSSDQ